MRLAGQVNTLRLLSATCWGNDLAAEIVHVSVLYWGRFVAIKINIAAYSQRYAYCADQFGRQH